MHVIRSAFFNSLRKKPNFFPIKRLRTGKLQGVTHDVIILHNIKLMRDFAGGPESERISVKNIEAKEYR